MIRPLLAAIALVLGFANTTQAQSDIQADLDYIAEQSVAVNPFSAGLRITTDGAALLWTTQIMGTMRIPADGILVLVESGAVRVRCTDGTECIEGVSGASEGVRFQVFPIYPALSARPETAEVARRLRVVLGQINALAKPAPPRPGLETSLLDPLGFGIIPCTLFGGSPEAAITCAALHVDAFASAMNQPPESYRASREGDALVVRTATCTTTIPVTAETTIEPYPDRDLVLRINSRPIRVDCTGSNPDPGRSSVIYRFETKAARDEAVRFGRDMLTRWADGAAAPTLMPASGAGCVSGTCTTGIGTWRYDTGNSYAGAWRDGKRDGRGTFSWTSGYTFTGDWVNDARVRGIHQFPDGNVYDGTFLDDKRHGQGTMTYADGGAYQGAWLADQRHGQGTYTYTGGNTYQGAWAGNKIHGRGTYTWTSGETFTGDWVDGSRVRGVNRYADGRVYDGEYSSDDKRDGQGTMTHPDGRVETGTWRDNVLLAAARATHPASTTGGHATPEPSDADPTAFSCLVGDCWSGYGVVLYTNGVQYDGEFLDGFSHGQGVLRAADGHTFTGEFRHGHGVGVQTVVDPFGVASWVRFDDDGNPVEILPND